jgi:hypothetical protein
MIYRKLKEFLLAREPAGEPAGEPGGEPGREPRAGGPAFLVDFGRLGIVAAGASTWALLSVLPLIAHDRGHVAIAEAWAERLLAFSDELGFDAGTAHAFALLGDLSAQQGERAGANQWYGKALDVYETLDDEQNAARMRAALADATRAQGAPQARPRAYSEALEPHTLAGRMARAALVKLGRPIEKQARKRWLGRDQ